MASWLSQVATIRSYGHQVLRSLSWVADNYVPAVLGHVMSLVLGQVDYVLGSPGLAVLVLGPV